MTTLSGLLRMTEQLLVVKTLDAFLGGLFPPYACVTQKSKHNVTVRWAHTRGYCNKTVKLHTGQQLCS